MKRISILLIVFVVFFIRVDSVLATACGSGGNGVCIPLLSPCAGGSTQVDVVNCTPVGTMVCCIPLPPPNIGPTPYPEPTPIDCDGVSNPLLYPSCALKELPNMAIFVVNMGIITGAVAGLIMLLYGGMLIILAADDTTKAENGRKAVLWSVMGLIVAASLFTVMQFVTSVLNIPGFTYVHTTYAANEYALEDSVSQTYQVFGTVRGSNDAILPGAKVILYQQTGDDWTSWDAQTQGNQRNPYEADVFGHYQFFAPEGTYYVVASKFGYHSAQSKPFEVVGFPLKQNITLEAASPIWVFVLYFGIMLFIGSSSYFAIVGIVRWRKRAELKQYAQRQIRNNTPERTSPQNQS